MIGAPHDGAVTIALIGSFSALVTLHVAILFGLARRRHFARAAASVVLLPLAPVSSWRAGMRARAIAWTIAAVAYAASVWLSS